MQALATTTPLIGSNPATVSVASTPQNSNAGKIILAVGLAAFVIGGASFLYWWYNKPKPTASDIVLPPASDTPTSAPISSQNIPTKGVGAGLVFMPDSIKRSKLMSKKF